MNDQRRHRLTCWVIFTIFVSTSVYSGEPIQLQKADSPADNPLKGIVPYMDAQVDRFPHSLEFHYLKLSDLMQGIDQFDWTKMESHLNTIASRGCQAVFRIWVEYPNQNTGVPSFLLDQGLKLTEWVNPQEKPPSKNRTPDYRDERLILAFESFIKAFGDRYDGDPRLGYLTAGLLGEWGEWHNWPREELFASKNVQSRVLVAYEKAFRKTPVLLRYPAGDDHTTYSANSKMRFGYHDDSFAWGTLDTHQKDDSWFYMALLRNAGPEAQSKWKEMPIGGEIRPELWGQIFDARPQHPQAQNFRDCIDQTHVTWLMDSGMFKRGQSEERIERAKAYIQTMGYDFRFLTAEIDRVDPKQLVVKVSIINQGVARIYSDWPIELGVLSVDGKVQKRFVTPWQLNSIQPSTNPTHWQIAIAVEEQEAKSSTRQFLGLRVIHPLANGKPLRFANAEQDQHASGWLTLGKLE